jgi:hypothetical protein
MFCSCSLLCSRWCWCWCSFSCVCYCNVNVYLHIHVYFHNLFLFMVKNMNPDTRYRHSKLSHFRTGQSDNRTGQLQHDKKTAWDRKKEHESWHQAWIWTWRYKTILLSVTGQTDITIITVGTRRLLHDKKTGQQWGRKTGAGKPWQDGQAGQPGEGS